MATTNKRAWLTIRSKLSEAELNNAVVYLLSMALAEGTKLDLPNISIDITWEAKLAFIAVACTRMKAKYYRVSRLVVLPDYQGIGVGKRILNFIAELYSSQTKMPFYILTSNPQIIRGYINNWKVERFGHASKGKNDSRINNEIPSSLSRKRITVSLRYVSRVKRALI